jgi:hypothetical protein
LPFPELAADRMRNQGEDTVLPLSRESGPHVSGWFWAVPAVMLDDGWDGPFFMEYAFKECLYLCFSNITKQPLNFWRRE